MPTQHETPDRHSNLPVEAQAQTVLNSAEPYVPVAAPRQQINACVDTCSRMCGLLHSQLPADEYAALLELVATITEASQNEQAAGEAVVAEWCVAATTIAAATYLFDEMRSLTLDGPGLPAQNAYARMYGLQGDEYNLELNEFGISEYPGLTDMHMLTPSELAYWIEGWGGDGTMVAVSSVSDFETAYLVQPDARFYFTRPLRKDEVVAVSALCGSRAPDALYVPVLFSDTCACFLTFSNVYSQATLPFKPRTELPREEAWLAFLHSGTALLAEYDRYNVQPAHTGRRLDEIISDLRRQLSTNMLLPAAGIPASRRAAIRRNLLLLRPNDQGATERARWLGELADKHRAHFLRLFADKYHSLGPAEVLMTRSGVSAIEAVLRAIKRQAQEDGAPVPTAAALGIYFENRPDSFFTYEADARLADVVFVNAQPSTPDVNRRFALGYDARRLTLIRNIRTHAERELKSARREHRQPRTYHLILDTTTDLDFEAFPPDDTLPTNLTIIDVASLTKHQRGERNHFFGAATVYDNARLAQLINEEVIAAEGMLTPSGIVHLPRLRPTEVSERELHIQGCTAAFTAAFDAAQSALAEHLRWHIEAHGYYLFLVPPFKRILHDYRVQHPGQPSNLYTSTNVDSDISELSPDLQRFLQVHTYPPINATTARMFRRHGAELGNSFNLGPTRILTVTAFVRDEQVDTHFRQPITRICIGSDATLASSAGLGRDMGAMIQRMMYDLS